MKRTGLVDLLMIPLVFGLIIVMLWLGGTLAGMVAEKSVSKAGLFYDTQSVGEVIDAPCAVDSRGVFYRSAIENGNFGCLNPHGTIILRFQVDGQTYTWAAERTESGAAVSASSSKPVDPQTYTVLVYDRDTGTRLPAVLNVGRASASAAPRSEVPPGWS